MEGREREGGEGGGIVLIFNITTHSIVPLNSLNPIVNTQPGLYQTVQNPKQNDPRSCSQHGVVTAVEFPLQPWYSSFLFSRFKPVVHQPFLNTSIFVVGPEILQVTLNLA